MNIKSESSIRSYSMRLRETKKGQTSDNLINILFPHSSSDLYIKSSAPTAIPTGVDFCGLSESEVNALLCRVGNFIITYCVAICSFLHVQ